MADAAFFGGGAALPAGLLPEVAAPERAEELAGRRWEVLALTPAGCQALEAAPEVVCACGTVLLPGAFGRLTQRQIRAERVVSCGLSPRDSLTVSSLGEGGTVVCVQRALVRADGRRVEPQELPLGPLGAPPEELLAAVGLRLLLESPRQKRGLSGTGRS